jgi:glycosyltransferase involved in cell wall biosynthesis
VNALVTTAHHFARMPNGHVYSTTGGRGYRFWERYLAAFGAVTVLARVAEVAAVTNEQERADGGGVSFLELPDYRGPQEYLAHAAKVHSVARRGLASDSAIILRPGLPVDSTVYACCRRSDRPYAVEVVGDPYDVFAPGAVRHPLRPLLRWWSPRRLRKLCAGACAAAYVTERTLQRRYPPAPDAYTTHYSSVELPAEAFVPAARVWAVPPDRTRLVFVGSLAQMYKAPDVLLEAVARCRAQGLACQLAMVGDGKHRSELEARARALGLEDSVRFMGQIPAGDAVRQQLDAADLFVLPSRTEGLPRAMIEAMARGLPCIGTSVGGIPELLPVEDLVSPGDADALAAKMRAMLADPQRMTAMSRRNLEKARQFADEVLRQRRTAFYTYVRERTEAWLKTPR